MRIITLGALALCLLSVGAQKPVSAAPHCVVPTTIAQPAIESPKPSEIRRVPVTGYVLALSWSPQFCREHQGDPRQDSQCNSGTPFEFILHGLWPEGEGRNDPAWCSAAGALPIAQIRANFCIMPSAKLQQHEWAKHGTCASRDPARYFKAASILFNSIHLPDMNALSRRGITVGAFQEEVSAMNTALPVSAIRVESGKGGWLKGVNICLGKDFRPRACPDGNGGTNADRALKIWRAVK